MKWLLSALFVLLFSFTAFGQVPAGNPMSAVHIEKTKAELSEAQKLQAQVSALRAENAQLRTALIQAQAQILQGQYTQSTEAAKAAQTDALNLIEQFRVQLKASKDAQWDWATMTFKEPVK